MVALACVVVVFGYNSHLLLLVFVDVDDHEDSSLCHPRIEPICPDNESSLNKLRQLAVVWLLSYSSYFTTAVGWLLVA